MYGESGECSKEFCVFDKVFPFAQTVSHVTITCSYFRFFINTSSCAGGAVISPWNFRHLNGILKDSFKILPKVTEK